MLLRSHLHKSAIVLALGMLGFTPIAPAVACTSLIYRDANGRPYHGQTMELGNDHAGREDL
jgi:penicillin V acylase-like amidase (Ntn superfamily)